MDDTIQAPAEERTTDLRSDLMLRAGGLAAIVGALATGWFFILRPLELARAGVPEVKLSINAGFVLVPLLLVGGVMYLVLGSKFEYRDTSVHPPKPLPMFWVMMVLFLAVGGGLLWYVLTQFDALGYS